MIAEGAPTILVTGANGFVGRALLARLLASGSEVVATDTRLGGLADHPRLRRVAGDLGDASVRAAAIGAGVGAIVHLATVPGGAAEADPALSRRVNLDAALDLLEDAAVSGGRPRVVFASSIAVFGEPLPVAGVDDDTPLAPRMIYAGHKAMIEVAVATLHHRGRVDGVSLRLPGILARPPGVSGMKSAFMSEVCHTLAAGRAFTCPVSPGATIWAQSIGACVDNLVHALGFDSAALSPTRAITLPALRVRMADLVAEVAHQAGVSADLVRYAPDPAIEAAFGAQPLLATPAAERAGFTHDGTLAKLVARACGDGAPTPTRAGAYQQEHR